MRQAMKIIWNVCVMKYNKAMKKCVVMIMRKIIMYVMKCQKWNNINNG